MKATRNPNFKESFHKKVTNSTNSQIRCLRGLWIAVIITLSIQSSEGQVSPISVQRSTYINQCPPQQDQNGAVGVFDSNLSGQCMVPTGSNESTSSASATQH